MEDIKDLIERQGKENCSNICATILTLDPTAKVSVGEEDVEQINWLDGNPNNITKEQILTRQAELIAEYDANKYQRDRQAEYPSISDLVVALYDTDDKAAIEAKRAEIKLKYPKPGA